MHLSLTAKQRALVASVEDFVGEWLPLARAESAYFEALCEQGWSAPSWPKPWGGGLALDEAFLVERTLALAGAPQLPARTLRLIGPLLMNLADKSLCHRYLPEMATGRICWVPHGSLLGAAPLSGRILDTQVVLDAQRVLAAGAGEATALAVVVGNGAHHALAVADLNAGDVLTNQPLDPDTVVLAGLNFDVLASTRTHPGLARALAGVSSGAPVGMSCWTGRLRRQLNRLTQTQEDEVGELSALGVTLTGLEVMEQRAVWAGDRAMHRALVIRASELGRALAELTIERLGYYALPALASARQHNELPASARTARDAMAELIRYLDADYGTQRDDLAQSLGLTGE